MDILLPVAVLVIWSLVVLAWAASARFPAAAALKIDIEDAKRTADLTAKLPAGVQYKMDNYNHLMEQPTLFYAAAVSLAVLGAGTGLNLTLAWAYVGIRIVHSFVHGTSNVVKLRFPLFLLSTACLLTLAVRLAMLAAE